MLKAVAISKQLVETNIEEATTRLFEVILGRPTDAPDDPFGTPVGGGRWVGDIPFLFLSADSLSPFLLIHLGEALIRHTAEPITEEPELLRPFLRGALREAINIWQFKRQLGRDFDVADTFFHRPWPRSSVLWQQCLLFRAAGPEGATVQSRDLCLFAVGREQEGLPRELRFDDTIYRSFCSQLASTSFAEVSANTPRVPVVTSLGRVDSPAWLSYDQWLARLQDTPQGAFVQAGTTQPQRIDGPAGSGKTLSLVLKCLATLKRANKAGTSHHAAFIAFSDETRTKILESFFSPLDAEEFHAKDRATYPQTVTVTTLLNWSRDELKGIADSYELSADDPAQARSDQKGIIAQVLQTHLPELLAAFGQRISEDLRAEVSTIDDTLISMFQHEFGVIIKGMADGDQVRYLQLVRPRIALSAHTEADRRFIFSLFRKYALSLEEFGVVDLDDVAISHIKLLQMPLRKRAREAAAFDSVFVDEAHSFNPNELGVLFLLAREAELPPIVAAVDVPQGLADKGYDKGRLEDVLLRGVDPDLRDRLQHYDLSDSQRCPQDIIDIAASVYAQGQRFFAPLRMPSPLRSGQGRRARSSPRVRGFLTREGMMAAVLDEANRIATELGCHRSSVLIVLMHPELVDALPEKLLSCSKLLRRSTDVEQEKIARRANHYVIARPEQVHGLEYEGVLIVGASDGQLPRSEVGRSRGGATALYQAQEAVDKLYLALTRSKEAVTVLHEGQISPLLEAAQKTGLLKPA